MNFCKTYKNLQFLQLSIHWILNLGGNHPKTTQIHSKPHRDFQALLNQKSLTTCEMQEQIARKNAIISIVSVSVPKFNYNRHQSCGIRVFYSIYIIKYMISFKN